MTDVIAAYKAACAEYNAAFAVWHPYPKLYRERKIDDAEFVAARHKFETAGAKWEAARAAAYPGT